MYASYSTYYSIAHKNNNNNKKSVLQIRFNFFFLTNQLKNYIQKRDEKKKRDRNYKLEQ